MLGEDDGENVAPDLDGERVTTVGRNVGDLLLEGDEVGLMVVGFFVGVIVLEVGLVEGLAVSPFLLGLVVGATVYLVGEIVGFFVGSFVGAKDGYGVGFVGA